MVETLRERAARAMARRHAWHRLQRLENETGRKSRAEKLLWDILRVPIDVPQLPIEVSGLFFDVSQYGENWKLNLLQPCIECSRLYPTTLNEMADLGEALEEGPSYCDQCDA